MVKQLVIFNLCVSRFSVIASAELEQRLPPEMPHRLNPYHDISANNFVMLVPTKFKSDPEPAGSARSDPAGGGSI
jgi:hypothetical protein